MRAVVAALGMLCAAASERSTEPPPGRCTGCGALPSTAHPVVTSGAIGARVGGSVVEVAFLVLPSRSDGDRALCVGCLRIALRAWANEGSAGAAVVRS